VATLTGQSRCDMSTAVVTPSDTARDEAAIEKAIVDGDASGLFGFWTDAVEATDYNRLRWFAGDVALRTSNRAPMVGIEALTLCMDRRYPTGDKKRSSVLTILRQGLETIFEAQPTFGDSANAAAGPIRRITWETRDRLRAPAEGEQVLLIDARGFSPEGEDCDARLAVKAYELGWRWFVHYNSRGTRFHAAGFGPLTDGLRVDCYDNPGDYLASGMDGLEAHVHCNAQDQLCQIAKRGKLVVHGDVGQTFLYGAKGGDIYVLGNAAGRPMINAVGKPRVIINGTALDFLAESFMAGNPHIGGGFAIINGLQIDDAGRFIPLDLPYPGSNLMSLASGGAIYVRDPHNTLVAEQLNGGAYRPLLDRDWKLILPYLQENERLFGIQIDRDLLTVDGVLRKPNRVYRKVMPRKDADLEAELEGMGE
jgi:glutamate synthase domain-containing protein 3